MGGPELQVDNLYVTAWLSLWGVKVSGSTDWRSEPLWLMLTSGWICSVSELMICFCLLVSPWQLRVSANTHGSPGDQDSWHWNKHVCLHVHVHVHVHACGFGPFDMLAFAAAKDLIIIRQKCCFFQNEKRFVLVSFSSKGLPVKAALWWPELMRRTDHRSGSCITSCLSLVSLFDLLRSA